MALHQSGENNHIHAYALLMGAAASWALSIVFVRAHHFTSTTLELAPWQMLTAAALLLPLAILVEELRLRLGQAVRYRSLT